MTLVVAHADQDICFMVADTLISHENFQLKGDVGPVNGEFHSLKIQVLSGSLAVGFAGSFDDSYAAIRALKRALADKQDIDPVTWLAEQKLERSDFLVLRNQDPRQLCHISGGKVRWMTNAYVGDIEEYGRFLELKKPYEGPIVRHEEREGVWLEHAVQQGEKEFDIVSDAMEALSRDRAGRKYPSVGAISGCVIRVVDARISGELEYLQAVEVSRFPWEPEGGYTVLAANTPERGVGIYFRAGGNGFLMPVCGEVACVQSYAPDLATFIREADEKFGMTLIGGTW